MRLYLYCKAVARDRWDRLAHTDWREDRGDALAWVLIAAAGVLLAAAVYAAINAKVLEKIGIINDA